MRFLRPIFYINELKKILRKIKPDIVHAHQVWIEGIVGACSGFHPFIITPWGSDVLIGPKSVFKSPLIRYALARADLLTCDGKNTRVALERLGVSQTKIKIIGFGVDMEKFKPAARDENLAKQIRLRGGPVVISLRSLKPVYNIETLIMSVPAVLRKIPEAEFIIAGEGEEKEKLIALARESKVERSVRFIGAIPASEINRYLNLAMAYVSTSLSDSGLSASTAEAMASGLPVIVSDSGDNKKIIRDGESGFVVPLKDPVALAEKIVRVLSDVAWSRDLGKKGRAIIEEKDNYRQEMAKMDGLYNELINSNA